MPDTNIKILNCTLYVRQWGMIAQFGHFTLKGDPKVLEAYGDQPLTAIPGLPPVPPLYQNFILKQFTVIELLGEMMLVFEKKQ
jgi:hypothetical protein